MKRLQDAVRRWDFPHTSVRVNRQGSDAKESTQRTRSFLFAALGAAAAVTLGVQDVFLADNGIVSLNLPVNDQMAGTLASRSTHPQVLLQMNHLLRLLWDEPPVVSNPLGTRTRAEVLEILKLSAVPALLHETNSCAYASRRPNEKSHCGVCSQCVDRRFASLAAGLAEHDPGDEYGTDIFQKSLPAGRARLMVTGVVTLAQRVGKLGDNDDDLFKEFPQFGELFDAADPLLSDHTLLAMALVRRQAATVQRVMADQIAAAGADLAAGRLPGDCLVRLVAGPSMAEAAKPERVVTLSAVQEAEFATQRCESRLPIFLTGETQRRAKNVLEVGDQTVEVDDAEFTLFLQLVLGLFERWERGGWLPLTEVKFWSVRSPTIVGDPQTRVEKSASRLREVFRGRLGRLHPQRFIERRASRIRLSTHPRYVNGDWAKLLTHPHQGIQELAQRLHDITDGRDQATGAA